MAEEKKTTGGGENNKNQMDKFLKSPHGTHVERGALGGVELIAEVERLEPRVGGVELRRTPVGVSRKTSSDSASHPSACVGGVTDCQIPSVTTQLV